MWPLLILIIGVEVDPQETGKISEAKQDFGEDKMGESQVCGARKIPNKTVSYVQAHGENTKDTFKSDTLKLSASSPMTSGSDNMKTIKGMLGQKIVNVLRDTGCTGVIVNQSLVPESSFTGRIHMCMVIDRSTLELPEAKVYLNTPYFEGEVIALCMKNPLVEVILGNIQGARDAHNPNNNWVLALAVHTRAQAKQREQSKLPLRTPNIVSSDGTPDQIRASQVSDWTWARIRTACEEEVIKGNAKYFKKNT